MCVPGCMETMHNALPRKPLPHAGAGPRRAAANRASTGTVAQRLACAAVGPFESVLDLTHTLSPEFPTFPGDPPFDVRPYAKLSEDGYNMNAWQLVEHSGTHLDAPIHFSDDGVSVDALEASALVVALAVVDVTAKAQGNADYRLSRDDLAAWEERYGTLPRGGCVAMHSGWGRLATADPARFIGRDDDGTLHFPGIAPEAALWLLQERQIVGLAVDTLSLDNGPSRDFPTHHVWLPTGRWGLENVANLDQAPATGAILVVGLPKVKGATGAPVRLLALIP
ncbi:MAG: cyclase family protein [Xanthobacteraceae bacterium]